MGVGSDWETVLVFEDFTDKVCRDFIFKKKKKKKRAIKKKEACHSCRTTGERSVSAQESEE